MNRSTFRFAGIIIFSASLLLAAASCRRPTVHGGGEIKSETRTTSGYYNRIEISAPVDAQIEVMAGSNPGISLNGYANILPYIKMKVEDSTLKIYTGHEIRLFTNNNIKAHIVIPALNGLDISGSSDVVVTGNVTGDAMDIEMAGSGTVKIDALNTHSLDVEMAGSSEIDVQRGQVDSASYEIAGSGDIHAYNLQSGTTSIDIAGSGSAEITSSAKLDVSISGSGDVSYKGNPVISKEIMGSGSIEQVK